MDGTLKDGDLRVASKEQLEQLKHDYVDLYEQTVGARGELAAQQKALDLAKKLLEVAGPVTTRRILLLGDPLPAERLYELGVISHIAEPADLETVAAAVIHRTSENAPLSLKTMKALIVREMAYRDQIPHADIDGLVEQVRRSEDAQEGMAARLARRKPAFKGR